MASTTTDLSTIIASLTRFLSLIIYFSTFINYPSWAKTEKPACVLENGKRQNCIKIIKTNVVENQISLILKATQANGRSINNLSPENFTVKVDGVELAKSATNFQKSEERSFPARIVMLLDYSGSMTAIDNSGSTKIDGAIRGIENFLAGLSSNNADIKVSIAPFGYPGQACQDNQMTRRLLRAGNPDNKQILDSFFPPGATQLRNYLSFLHNHPLCPSTATNLYDALAQTLEFLGDRRNQDLYPPADSNRPQPVLFIVLLSDGFNSVPFDPLYPDVRNVQQRCSEAHLKKLQQEYLSANKYAEITIYTLGYGLTPEELGNRYNLGRPATCQDLNFNPHTEQLPVPAKEFVDREALNKIANLKGGFVNFSGSADGIVQSFSNFRDSIVGEYEITYEQPNAERSSQHQVEVVVPFENQQLSDTEEYTIRGIGGLSVPLLTRMATLSSAIAFAGLFGAIPFYFWTKKLKQKS